MKKFIIALLNIQKPPQIPLQNLTGIMEIWTKKGPDCSIKFMHLNDPRLTFWCPMRFQIFIVRFFAFFSSLIQYIIYCICPILLDFVRFLPVFEPIFEYLFLNNLIGGINWFAACTATDVMKVHANNGLILVSKIRV